DGALVTFVGNVPKSIVDASNGTELTRETGEHPLTTVEVDGEKQELWTADAIGLSLNRSTDHGKTWSSIVVAKAPALDGPEFAIDNHAGSPHAGHVYLGWRDGAARSFAFARSVDGGRTVEEPITLGGRNGTPWADIAVAPDGTVHVLWICWEWESPTP